MCRIEILGAQDEKILIEYLANSVLAQMVARSKRWGVEVMAQSMGNRMARHAGTNQNGRYYVSKSI